MAVKKKAKPKKRGLRSEPKITSGYRCDFPGCEKFHQSSIKAEKCYEQGSIGPKILPGTVFGEINPERTGYLILLQTFADRGHKKEYAVLEINYPFLKEVESSKEELWAYIKRFTRDLDYLEEFKNRKVLEELSKEEFTEFSNVIHKTKGGGFDHIRVYLNQFHIKKLRRKSPSLEKYMTQDKS